MLSFPKIFYVWNCWQFAWNVACKKEIEYNFQEVHINLKSLLKASHFSKNHCCVKWKTIDFISKETFNFLSKKKEERIKKLLFIYDFFFSFSDNGQIQSPRWFSSRKLHMFLPSQNAKILLQTSSQRKANLCHSLLQIYW